nr:uncharacterized protein CI109_002382 [Kwoniella shandongensis]KAA5529041.1 hypothetical protein CI109_002382 [Kwoniella shandongensis]
MNSVATTTNTLASSPDKSCPSSGAVSAIATAAELTRRGYRSSKFDSQVEGGSEFSKKVESHLSNLSSSTPDVRNYLHDIITGAWFEGKKDAEFKVHPDINEEMTDSQKQEATKLFELGKEKFGKMDQWSRHKWTCQYKEGFDKVWGARFPGASKTSSSSSSSRTATKKSRDRLRDAPKDCLEEARERFAKNRENSSKNSERDEILRKGFENWRTRTHPPKPTRKGNSTDVSTSVGVGENDSYKEVKVREEYPDGGWKSESRIYNSDGTETGGNWSDSSGRTAEWRSGPPSTTPAVPAY